MTFLDVLFPINLGPLTYRCPEELSDIAEPGMIVTAPLKNRTAKGVIIGKSLTVLTGDVKDIQKVFGDAPVLSSKMINLLRWMSEYYLAEQGLVLKNMLPKEAFTKVKKRKAKTKQTTEYPLNIININDRTVSGLALNLIRGSINKNTYKTFLLHAPSFVYECSFLIKVLTGTENAILLIPEVSLINNLYPLLSEKFEERVCLFHSGLSRGKRSEAVDRILSGYSDIVVGTRSAVFAPLKKVSFIAVIHEHSSSYKQEDGLCYSGRDIAVMRGYLERATVLLSSICPSIESLYNCKKGKYTLIKPTDDVKKPKVKVIDMRYEKLLKPYLSKKVVDASLRHIKNNKKVMFVINRKGYSTLLLCMDCNYIEECPDCRIPLVLHKQDTDNGHGLWIMKCHYCGHISDVSESCRRCKGYNIKLLGAGTQKIQEDIEEFIGIKTLRFDSDKVRKSSDIEGLIGALLRDDSRIIIGTKLMTRRLYIQGFSMAAILNTDLFLNLPDFRSAEKAFQEISSIIDKIEPDSEIFIQTRMPQNYVFKHLKDYSYASFFREEMYRRKSLSYPPYSRLLLIKFISKRDLSRELSEIIGRADKDVEILGPSISNNTRGKHEFRLLLKSSIRGGLHSVARTFIEAFKDSKDITIRVDVDPITI
ncbi:MAG: primosomal protein N' [Nitrospirota bacterium]